MNNKHVLEPGRRRGVAMCGVFFLMVALCNGMAADVAGSVRVAESDVSAIFPKGWHVTVEAENSRVIVKQMPMRMRNANLTVQVHSTGVPLDRWQAFHRAQQIDSRFPGSEIASESRLTTADGEAVLFHVAGLTDAYAGQNLWSGRFDRNLDDVLNVQDELMRSIVDNEDLQSLLRTDKSLQDVVCGLVSMNRYGRDYLLDDATSLGDGIHILHLVHDSVDCLMIHLRENAGFFFGRWHESKRIN